jgi:hypothetical protein
MTLDMRCLCRLIPFLFASLSPFLCAQSLQGPGDPVRVTVSLNADGSRTTYRFDPTNRKAVSTTESRDGKSLGATHYTLDDAGRFATGAIYGPDHRLRFKSTYKYDDAGKEMQEVQSDKSGAVLHKIVYAYDSSGKQTGYSIYDGSGKLVSRVAAPVGTPVPAKKKSR